VSIYEPQPSLNGLSGAFFKFFGGTLFGFLVSGTVFLLVLWLQINLRFHQLDFIWETPYIHAFWLLPVGWGLLSIFFFEGMLSLGKEFIETFFKIGG